MEVGIISRADGSGGPVRRLYGGDAGEGYDQRSGRGAVRKKKTLDRSRLWQIQTPQAFSCGLICRAYEELFADPGRQAGVTDDAMVVEAMTGARVRLVEGSYENLKGYHSGGPGDRRVPSKKKAFGERKRPLRKTGEKPAKSA